ncbi:hypothetical protein J6590_047060, partial [Homalodisca vitripennis]
HVAQVAPVNNGYSTGGLSELPDQGKSLLKCSLAGIRVPIMFGKRFTVIWLDRFTSKLWDVGI